MKKAPAKPAPAYLDEGGKKYWNRFRDLIDLSGTNYDTLALLCSALSLYWRAEAEIQKQPLLNEFSQRPNQCFAIQKQAFAQAKDCIRIFRQAGDTVDIDDDDPLLKMVGA